MKTTKSDGQDPLLDHLTDAQRAEATQILRYAAAEYGEVLLEEGDSDPSLAWIVSGQVAVSMGSLELGVAGPGEIVGDGVFVDPLRACRVKAISPCRIGVIERVSLDFLRQAGNPVAWRIERAALTSSIRWVRVVNEAISGIAWGDPVTFEHASLLERLRSWLADPSGAAMALDAREAMARSAALAGVGPELLDALAERMSATSWPERTAILLEGQRADRVHLLVEGEVHALRHAAAGHVETLGTLVPGAIFGVGSAADGKPHSATCVAHTRVTTLWMDAQEWHDLIEEDSALGSAARVAGIRALSDAFAWGSAQLLGLEHARRDAIHRSVAPLYGVGTPIEVRPDSHPEGRPLRLIFAE